MIRAACLLLMLIVTTPVGGEVLRELRFEPPAFTAGALPQRDDLQVTGGAGTPFRIETTGEAAFGQALRVPAPEDANANLIVRFTPRRTGTLVVSFDVRTEARARAMNLLLAPANADAEAIFDLATAYLTWDGGSNRVRHFDGRWNDITTYTPGRWHHVDLLVHLSGEDAGTLDVNVNGGAFEAVQLPWRNALPTDGSLAFGQLWIIGQQQPRDAAAGHATLIDNLVVTHVPPAQPEP